MNGEQGTEAPQVSLDDIQVVNSDSKPLPTEPAKESQPEVKATETVDKTPEEKESAVQRRIAQLTREKYEARGQWKAEREANLKFQQEVIQRLQNPDSQPQQPQVSPQEIYEKAMFDSRCNSVVQQGAKIPGFTEALATFQQFGLDRAKLEPILEADDPAKVIQYLGNNPDEADEILSKNPIAMARAIAKLEDKISSTPAISKAPPPLEATKSKVTSEEPTNIDAWMAKRNADEDAKRSQRRRR